MKKTGIALVLFLFTLSVMLMAQQKSTTKKTDTETRSEQMGFTAMKKAPQYKGGKEAMSKFIYQNMQYPEDAKEQKIEGDVELQFYVDVDGSVTNVQVVKKVSPSIDAEAIRVVKSMPGWIPGQNGVIKIMMKTSLIIGFHLNK
ncbi:MAG: TonB family protein [Paludibacteraceae bacterium]|nr:TonB family protein [Paludibacteraceae bacterium]